MKRIMTATMATVRAQGLWQLRVHAGRMSINAGASSRREARERTKHQYDWRCVALIARLQAARDKLARFVDAATEVNTKPAAGRRRK